ncbi:hypothetical protein BZG01_11370 [Labilibaculum manganireducens]|uniref:RES domain-containing protein n=1 Tax=Labilibaculum manganireducens TaxID=1940525 RepID=A0A2N3I7W7_9BACT|nr:hypothetical protein [Labilibaculum manganireducens]PKQ66397.1 hypothetical protein BZG01_11370 [Labilibaculum manganireducens]
MNIDIFKECFRNISIKDLVENIDDYHNLSYSKNISEENLRKVLRRIFKVKINGRDSTFFLRSDTETYKGELHFFYRVRKFESQDYESLNSSLSFPSMSNEQDAWCKPDKLSLEYGRLNRPNQSVLYASYRPSDAIYETNCKTGEYFYLMVYKNSKTMRMSQIHKVNYMDEFTEMENAKRLIMHNFLLSEFTRLVPSGREYLYKSPLLIYEEYFKDPFIDGFTYPTIASNANRGFNVCFEKYKAKQNLELQGVIVCKLSPPNDTCEFVVEQFYDGFLNEKNGFDFYPSTSELAKSKFGQFSYIRNMGL